MDYHLVLDLVPPLAAAYLRGRLPATLSTGQAAILLVGRMSMYDVNRDNSVLYT